MTRQKIAPAAALGVLAALMLIKALWPGTAARAAAPLRDRVDYRAVFAALGDALSLAGPEIAAEAAPSPAPARSPALLVGYRLEEAAVLGEFPPEEPEPAAVAAFLEAQAAFADYPLPENASYRYVSLPFETAVPVSGFRSDGFGYRVHPILGDVRFHYGTDVAAWTGEEIHAFAAGTVLAAGTSDSFGNYVELDHADGWTTLYAHCSALSVTAGQRVAAGEVIALVGGTGMATGPHLHLELRRDGVYYNPEYYIND